MLLVAGDEFVLRAVYPPHWEEETSTWAIDLFANKDVSVSRLSISSIEDIYLALKNDLAEGTEIKGFAQIQVSQVLDVIHYPLKRHLKPDGTQHEKLPRGVPENLRARVKEVRTDNNPAHAEIEVSDNDDFTTSRKITQFYSRQLCDESTWVSAPAIE